MVLAGRNAHLLIVAEQDLPILSGPVSIVDEKLHNDVFGTAGLSVGHTFICTLVDVAVFTHALFGCAEVGSNFTHLLAQVFLVEAVVPSREEEAIVPAQCLVGLHVPESVNGFTVSGLAFDGAQKVSLIILDSVSTRRPPVCLHAVHFLLEPGNEGLGVCTE